MTAIAHSVYSRLSPRVTWKLAGALLALGAYLAPGRRVRHGGHGHLCRQPRLTVLPVLAAHYLLALTQSEESAITRRWVRVAGRSLVGAAAVGLATLAGV
jgi:hypothetical protein